MKAIQVERPGGPEAMKPAELPLPKPGKDELLVKVGAAGVNFIDIYRRSGIYKSAFPYVPGVEGAGVVEAAGEFATTPVGTRVAWASGQTGSYAEYALVDERRAAPIPEGVSEATAAATALQGMTADFLVRDAFPVTEGTTAVLYAAAGGVGSLAAQMILAAGARLIAVVGSTAKIDQLTGLGVPEDHILVTGAMDNVTAELPQQVRKLTDGEGAQVVYDSVGRDTFAASLAMAARRGTVVLFGGASGQVPPFDPQELNAHGSLYLTRPKLDDYVPTRQALAERAERVWRQVAEGALKVAVSRQYPLDQAAQAHRDLASRTTTGKLLIIP